MKLQTIEWMTKEATEEGLFNVSRSDDIAFHNALLEIYFTTEDST